MDRQQSRTRYQKAFPVTFVQASFAIVRMAIVSVLFIGIFLILPAGISQARAVEKVQPANQAALTSTSLKTIIVGDYYPYTFVNDKGVPDGFSVDVAKAVVGVMDRKLEISVDTWEHATIALAEGTIDLLPMMASSPERDKSFDFSAPHTIAYDAVFLRNGAQRISSLKDLIDKTVIVMNKDAAHQYLLSSGMAARMKLILVDSLPDALRTLAERKGDAALMPKLVGLIIMKKLNLTNLDPSPVVIDAYNRPFCFAVKDGNQALLERLSQGLSIIKSTGQYQEIYKKWFGALEPPGLSWESVIKYIGAIIAVFLLIALGLILWTVALRKQVSLRTKNLADEIQERKRSEEALRKSEEKYRLIAENTADVISIMDMNLHFTYVSPATMRLRGFTVEEAMEQTLEQVLTPESMRLGLTVFEEEMQLEASGTADPDRMRILEFEEYKKDGSIIWVEVSFSVLRDKDRKPVEILIVSRDITARKRVEEELSRNQDVTERLAQEIAIIAEIGKVIGSTLDTEEVYERFAAETQKLILFDSLTINLYNFQENTLCVAYVSGLDIDGRRQGDPLVLEGSLSEAVIRARISLRIQPASIDEIVGQFPRLSPIFQAGLRSIMCVPLVYRDEVIGVLHFRSKKPNAYTEQDLRLAEKIGEQIAGAIANAQLYTGLKKTEQELKESEQRYRELSIIDDLTQLYNSRHFYFQLKIELDRSNRYEQPLTLLLLDLDNFKAFNDAYGHVEGDQVLRRHGQVVKRCLRETDFAYRYGGEEFTILLPMTTSADGAVTAERIRTEFKKETFSPAPGQDVHVTVSIGLAQYKPQEEMKAFVHRVDQRMYQAKKNGKDRVYSEL